MISRQGNRAVPSGRVRLRPPLGARNRRDGHATARASRLASGAVNSCVDAGLFVVPQLAATRTPDRSFRRRAVAIMRRFLFGWLALAGAGVVLAQTPGTAPIEVPKRTVADILAKNAAARGGTEAWKKTQTMVWAGHTESSSVPGRKLPFLLEFKRPDHMRFEIASGAGKAVRIYDGKDGWKVHPDSSGLPELQPYTAEELAFARSAQVIDGPLMDYAAKGGAITLAGVDTVEGRKAYVLKAKLPSGDGGRVWVDAESFLELRLDREVAVETGRTANSTMFFRDYRAFQGLRIPIVIETATGLAHTTDKLVLEKVAINPAIDDKTFAKPLVGASRHGGVVIDTRSAASPAAGSPPKQPPK